MTSIRADNEIGAKVAFAVRSLYPNTRDALLVENEIDHFMLHLEDERRKVLGFGREKIQKIPLGHERDEFAVRRQTREVRHRNEVTIEDSLQLRKFLMR